MQLPSGDRQITAGRRRRGAGARPARDLEATVRELLEELCEPGDIDAA